MTHDVYRIVYLQNKIAHNTSRINSNGQRFQKLYQKEELLPMRTFNDYFRVI